MPKVKIIKLHNLTPMHIGTGRENYDSSCSVLHSDTLSAALASTGIITGIISDPLKFMSSFRISSALPYWKDSFFLPKPQGRMKIKVLGQEERQYRKKLKDVKYVELPLWERMAAGEIPEIDGRQIQDSFITLYDKNIGTMHKSSVTERVCVSRDGKEDADPFDFEWQFYGPNAGLYCMIETEDANFKIIEKLFSILGENGIGTDKSSGGGKFEIETDTIEIIEPEDADATMLLSLYIPTEEELRWLLDRNPRYSLILRGGYMAGSNNETFRHLRKKSIYMFGTGSVFKTTKALNGKIVDLRPEWNDTEMHPVYRSGLPFSIRLKLTDNEQS